MCSCTLRIAAAVALAASPAAAQVIVFSGLQGGQWDLWRMAPEDTAPARITNTREVDERSPAASPQGMLAYSTNAGEIWISDLDGANAKKLAEADGYCDTPTWTPDGKRVAFGVSKLDNGDVSEFFQATVEDGEQDKLLTLSRTEYYPAWAPRENVLAFSRFTRDELGNVVEELWTWAPEQDRLTQRTRTGADNTNAAWSPDGERLAFSSNLAGQYDLWLLSFDPVQVLRLTQHPAFDGHPAWSPDGRRIAFISSRGGSRQVWVLDVESGEAQMLETNLDQCADPCWPAGG